VYLSLDGLEMTRHQVGNEFAQPTTHYYDMAVEQIKKTPSVSHRALARTSGNATPTSSSSSGAESLDDADKTLEALGYTPVAIPLTATASCATY